MKRNILSALCVAAALAGFAANSQGEYIGPLAVNFDDLGSAVGTPIKNGNLGAKLTDYQGLTWQNFAFATAQTPGAQGSEFNNGVTTANNLAYNNGGQQAASFTTSGIEGSFDQFSLKSIAMTSVYYDNLTITITGQFADDTTIDKVITLSAGAAPTIVNFGSGLLGDSNEYANLGALNWNNLVTVSFHQTGGSVDPLFTSPFSAYSNGGTATASANRTFTIDDVEIAVPEPSTWVGLAASLGSVVLLAGSRRKYAKA